LAKSKLQKFLDEDNTKEIEYIKMMYYSEMSHLEKTQMLAKRYDVTRRTIRNWFIKLNLTDNHFKLPPELRKARKRDIDSDTDMLFVTYAQNKTLPNFKMLHSMFRYKEFVQKEFGLKVQILIIPGRYRNPTSPVEGRTTKQDQWWHADLTDYLYYNKIEFSDSFIAADTRVRPTAKMPLTGFESMVGDNHLVLGHPRIHLKTMPRFKGDPLRLMTTTGSITTKNYSISKAGDIGYIHHSYGFTVLEKTKEDPNICHPPRAVKVNQDGDFVDLGYHVTPDKVEKIKSSESFILGDIHRRSLDPQKYNASSKLMKILNPDMVVMHDLNDASTVNPHESKDFYIQRKKIRDGQYLVKDEEREVMDFVESFLEDHPCDLKVIQSNHDDFLDRWVNNTDWKKDLHNSDTYLRYAKIQQTEDIEKYGNLFGYLLSQEFPKSVEYITSVDSLRVRGYQIGKHGHQGVNGARGSERSFKKMNTKMIYGHKHSPLIIDGVTVVGTSTYLWMYYNSAGASAWAHADSVIYPNGKNQLIIFGDDYKISRLIDV